MWVFAPEGFYSAVEHRRDPGVIIVRARVKDDLLNLRVADAYERIFYDVYADYPWRIEVSRAEWTQEVARMAVAIDYPNFKDAVSVRQGKDRASVYMRVWSAVTHLEVAWSDRQRRLTGGDDWPPVGKRKAKKQAKKRKGAGR